VKGCRAASDANRALFDARAHTTVLAESRLCRAVELLGRERPGLLLDLGCGDGAFGEELERQGWRVVGVDVAPRHLTTSAGRLTGAIAGDVAASLPVRSGSVDAVFAGEVVEHVVDTDGFMSEVARVLRPGGSVVITTPNLASLENRVRILLGRYPVWVDYRLGGEGHVRAYTPRVLRRQLAEHGLRVETHTGNWVPLIPQRWADDLRLPWLAKTGKWAPGLAMDIIMSARRAPMSHRPEPSSNG